MKDHHHPSSPSPSHVHAHIHQTHTTTYPTSSSPAPSSSLHTTIQRVLSNAFAVYGSTRHLDVITYSAASSHLSTAAIVEHNPQGRAYIHCCSAPETSRLAAVEHLLVITEDLLARLVEMDDGTGSEGGKGIKECGWGWLPSTPQSAHAVVFGRQNSFINNQQQQPPLLQAGGGGGGGSSRSTPGNNTMSQTQLLHPQHQHYLQHQPHHNYPHPQLPYLRDTNNNNHHRRTSSFGSLPNLNSLSARFDSAPLTRRESMANNGNGNGNGIPGGGRVEGTVTTSSSNVSTPVPPPPVPQQNSHPQLGGTAHGIVRHGHGNALLRSPAQRSTSSPVVGAAAAAAAAGSSSSSSVAAPRPQRGGEKVKWIMGSEG